MGNRTRVALVAILLEICATTASARPATQILSQVPREYRGEWTNQQRYCNFEGDDLDSVLTVAGTHVGYFENHWRVRSVRVTANGLFLTYWPRTDFTMYAPNRLRLSRDKMRIFTSDGRADRGTRRCPKARG